MTNLGIHSGWRLNQRAPAQTKIKAGHYDFSVDETETKPQ